MILFSLIDIVYGPSKRKYVLALTGKEGALRANSLLTGVSGAAYLVGPVTAGFLTDSYGPAPAILFAAGCCIISSLVTLVSGMIQGKPARRVKAYGTGLQWRSGLADGIRYCAKTQPVRAVLIIGLVTGFCTVSVNLAFYPYAFDMLKVTAKGWSLMISIFYGTNLISMLLVKCFRNRVRMNAGRIFYAGLAIVSILWFIYAFLTEYAAVIALQFIEGTVIALCGILLISRLQVITDGRAIARVSAISDIFSNVRKLAGMGFSIILSSHFYCGSVFLLNGAILFLFALTGFENSSWSKEKTF
jgi:MFS family permease